MSTFLPANRLLQKQYRRHNYAKYSDLIYDLLQTEKYDELLTNNGTLSLPWKKNKMAPSAFSGPCLRNPVGRLFRVAPLGLPGDGNHVTLALLILCSRVSGLSASTGPQAKASAATIGFFLPSLLIHFLDPSPSTSIRLAVFLHDLEKLIHYLRQANER